MARTRTPPQRFWTHELEVPVEHVRRRMDAGRLDDWVSKRTGRQLTILCDAFGLEAASTRKKRRAIRGLDSKLEPYVLVDRFSQFKSKVAVLEFAEGVLPGDVVAECMKGEDDPDKTALLFAIYNRRWADLPLVLHLDKVHKKGFARMELRGRPRKPKQRFEAFLTEDSLKTVLAAFDMSRRDSLTSELMSVIPQDGRILAFIRRAERPDHLVRAGGDVVHGYRSEWIILCFADNAERVDISSVSIDVPLEIANGIASAYLGEECEFDNACVLTDPDQIEAFLAEVRRISDGPLVLVEFVCKQSPLAGSPGIRLRHDNGTSVGDAIAHFEKAIGTVRLEDIQSVKVMFRKKRVSLILEESEEDANAIVVRYSDHRLNARERVAFEDHMRDEYGITVLSTEKRFKHSA